MMRILVAMSLVACGSNPTESVDAAIDAQSVDAYPTAVHAPWPQLPNLGGPRLTTPQLVTITFANDTRAPTFEAFATWIVGSDWLTAAGAEYGIHHGGVAGVAHRPETPAAQLTSADVEGYIAAGIADSSIPRPANLGDALFIAYYPSTTTITAALAGGPAVSCVNFLGYHSEVHQGGLDFAYALIPTCPGNLPGLTALETLETVTAHEVIEASTDAWPLTMPAYSLAKDQTDPWFTTFQFVVEDGDLCEAPSRFVREAGFAAQRSWSNAAAAAGGDPCVPGAITPAFGASLSPSTVLKLAPGASADVTITGWSTGPVTDWKLTIQPFSLPGFASTRTKVALAATTLNNGMTTTVHVTVPIGQPSGTHSGFVIVSSHGTDEDASVWPLSVDAQ